MAMAMYPRTARTQRILIVIILVEAGTQGIIIVLLLVEVGVDGVRCCFGLFHCGPTGFHGRISRNLSGSQG